MTHRAADPLDSQVKCRTCGTAQRVSYTECVRLGWPRCCGETMSLVTHTGPADSGIFNVPDHLRMADDS